MPKETKQSKAEEEKKLKLTKKGEVREELSDEDLEGVAGGAGPTQAFSNGFSPPVQAFSNGFSPPVQAFSNGFNPTTQPMPPPPQKKK